MGEYASLHGQIRYRGERGITCDTAEATLRERPCGHLSLGLLSAVAESGVTTVS